MSCNIRHPVWIPVMILCALTVGAPGTFAQDRGVNQPGAAGNRPR